MFSDFKFLLNRAVRRSGASPYVEEKSILGHFSECLGDIFGQKISESIHILDFSQGAINVACLKEEDAIYLKENENILIDKINGKLDKIIVNEIKVLT